MAHVRGMDGRKPFDLQWSVWMMVMMMVKIKIDKDEDKYSLGGQGQDPKAGLVGPLTHPVQLKGNGHDNFLEKNNNAQNYDDIFVLL